MQIGSETRDVDVEHIVAEVEDHILREELRSCQHLLVDSELQRARHKVFTHPVETFNETIVNEKLDHFFHNSEKCSKGESGFWFLFEKKRRWRVQILLRTGTHYPAGSIQTCVQP